jgi:hypothetical protein
MACLNFDLTPVPSAVLTTTGVAAATLAVTTAEKPTLAVVPPTEQPSLAVTPAEQAALAVTPVQQATLTLGEVCTVSNDTIVVLAASDGPLRTRDGGYILLNPATNPPQS